MLNLTIKTLCKILVLSSYFLMLNAHADVRLWLSTATTDGNIGGRAGADAHCDGDANKPVVAASTTRAFISVDGADEIRDMPANYTIPTNETIFQVDGATQIAANFPALLDAGTTPLTNIVGGATNVYTGSGVDGSLNSLFNCINWTSNNMANSGLGGVSNALDQTYITGSARTCNGAIPLYCITFTAPVPVSGKASLVEW